MDVEYRRIGTEAKLVLQATSGMETGLKLSKNTRWDLLALGVVVALLFILFQPRIFNASWAFTDDGVFLELLHKDLKSVLNGQLHDVLVDFQTSGRFIPSAIMTYMIRLWIGGINPQAHYLFGFFLALVSSIGLYVTIRLLTENTVAALGGTAVFLLFSSNWENFYRLYPVESLVTPALSLFAVTVTALETNRVARVKYLLVFFAVFTLAYSIFAKETTLVMLLPISFAVFIALRNASFNDIAKKFWTQILLGVLLIVISWVAIKSIAGIPSVQAGWYSSYYEFSLSRILTSVSKYLDVFWNQGGPFLFVLFGVGLFVLWRIGRAEQHSKVVFWTFFFFIWGMGFVLILLPWRFAIGRYLMPAVWAFAVVVGILWAQIFQSPWIFSRKITVLIRSILIICSGIYMVVNLVRINHMVNWMYVRDYTNSQLLDFLSKYPEPQSTRLWFTFPEPVETYSHINPLLRVMHGISYESVDRLDGNDYLNQWRAGDLVIIPDAEGDGHFSCDGMFERSYRNTIERLITPYCTVIWASTLGRRSTTIYLDSPLYNYLKKAGFSIPQEVIGSRPSRKLRDDQMLMKSWAVYKVKS